MKKKIIGCLLIGLFSFINVSAQETFKVMFYNLLNYPLEDAVANREADLDFILSDYKPDLFLVCELNNSTGADNVLNITRTAINSSFEMATYISNTSDDFGGNQNDLQNLLYYNGSKFILEDQIIVPTNLRDFNIYKLLLNTTQQNTNPVEIYIIVCHLKASSGTLNAQRRFEMVLELETYLNTLPTNSNVLLGGDLNIYTASESAFQELLETTNSITFADPADRVGSWNNNPNFVDVFTQSTRTQNGFGGSTGGFDDRFDFILSSQNMLGTSTINYVEDSYQVYGNNGLASCYNRRINSSDCGNTNSQFSFATRNALHNFSDHLPVTVSLDANVTLLSTDTVLRLEKFRIEKTIINNLLTIYINSFELFNQELQVYNTIGQKVKTFKINNATKQELDMSDLEQGLYYLHISNLSINPIKFIITH
ncbi:T9SS type A sorting domain-containing protein [uncultured Winogradskyella sp.]|uniref:T9SS type A sorting domain-containing protein n=1 Tax=uncultured Winogradskyella sp. TaxID=395353 RepID=UPI0030DAF1C3|tara:strand:- start:27229 stop:28503 length:1275 start_codon:yes stop_codon:yes gene_type:complete